MTELKIRKTVGDGVERSRAKAVTPSTKQSLYKKRTQIYPKRVNGTFTGN